jgi:type I restriction enzyme M protein
MRKSLGEKRKRVSDDQIAEIVRLYGEFTEGDRVKIFPNEAFGFQRITVERPLRAALGGHRRHPRGDRADKRLAKLDDPTRGRPLAPSSPTCGATTWVTAPPPTSAASRPCPRDLGV